MVCASFALASISLAANDMWRAKTPMPTPRGYLSINSVVNGKIYAIGGLGGLWWNVASVEVYDPVADMWEKRTDMPTARHAIGTSVVDGVIYTIGGSLPGLCSTVEAYDPVADKWEKKANMPTARGALSASVVDGKIYAIGGLMGDGPTSTVEEYDPVADRWIKKANMPTARYGLSTSVVNGRIYAIGGAPSQQVTFATVEEYDPAIDKWTPKADMPTSRFYHSASVVNGKIYAIGGWTGDAEGEDALSTVEVYDPVTDKWTDKADLPTARGGLSTSVVNGKIYAVGGEIIEGGLALCLPTVEEYTPEGWQAVSPQGKLAAAWGKIKSD
jgi:N-acetylneuraminic acid mutarotase